MSGPIGSSQLMYSTGAGDFYTHQIANSCRFDSASSSYLTRSAGTPSNANIATFSCWIKRGNLANMGESSGSPQCIVAGGNEMYEFYDGAHDDKIKWTGGNAGDYLTTGEVYRDSSAWYNLVFRYDSTGSTASEYVRIYKNGTLIDPATYTEQSYSAQNEATKIGQSSPVRLGNEGSGSEDNFFDGYMAEVVFCDGQSLDASSFGETKNGVWIPKNPSGLTFGTNGFYLKFENASDLGNDSSGNNNDFTSSGLGADHQTGDTPTFNSSSNGGNFATLNPLAKGSYATLSEGNLRASGNSSDGSYVPSTMAFKTGKWYAEMLVVDQLEGWPYIAIFDYANQAYSPTLGTTYAIRYQADDDLEANTGAPISNFGTINLTSTGLGTYTDGDIIGVHLDCDNKKVWFTKNGAFVNSGDPSAGTNPQATWTGTPTIAIMMATYQNYDVIANFGQEGSFAGAKTAQGNADGNGYGDFYYAPDTGFLAMCAANVPIAAGVDPAETDDDYSQKAFDALTYVGNGQSRTISTDFKSDLLWIKDMDASRRHYLVTNTINANFGSTSYLHPSNAVSEGNSSDGVTASSASNFTISGSLDYVNNNTNNYVAYQWRLNGGTTAALNDGDINATGQINQTHGHGILLYTGDGGSSAVTMAHGMGAKPEFLWMKDRDSNGNNNQWGCWHHHMAADHYLYLSQNAAQAASGNGSVDTDQITSSLLAWNRTSTTGGSQTRFENGDNFIIYQFFGVEGHSKFASFEGNGNADGTFVYTGFSPALVMIKSIDSTSDWEMYDNVRAGYNVDNNQLEANDEAAQDTGTFIDLLSNGFKMRASGDPNVAESYLYAAWAHNSLKYATAV